MAYTLVTHKVEDYEKWKTVFEGAVEFRKSHGELSYQVFRDSSDPNTVTILNKWSDLSKAKEFFTLDELKQKMKEGGMNSEPAIRFLNEE